MRTWIPLVFAACSSSSAEPVETDAKPPASWKYLSDCSMTHPIATDPCSRPPGNARGLKSCKAIGVDYNKACVAGAPSCYVERTCADGRKVPSDFLVCAKQRPGKCFTRSAARFKTDIEYLTETDRGALARQVQQLPLARYRYREETAGTRLGFLVDDAASAPFVDGESVDLYALLSATIATVQQQDRRIRALEDRLATCADEVNPP